jgi:hypothetical protein
MTRYRYKLSYKLPCGVYYEMPLAYEAQTVNLLKEKYEVIVREVPIWDASPIIHDVNTW